MVDIPWHHAQRLNLLSYMDRGYGDLYHLISVRESVNSTHYGHPSEKATKRSFSPCKDRNFWFWKRFGAGHPRFRTAAPLRTSTVSTESLDETFALTQIRTIAAVRRKANDFQNQVAVCAKQASSNNHQFSPTNTSRRGASSSRGPSQSERSCGRTTERKELVVFLAKEGQGTI